MPLSSKPVENSARELRCLTTARLVFSLFYYSLPEPGLLLAKDFRSANVHPGSEVTGLMDRALTVIPEWTELHFRSDAACYNKDVV